ncbi:hypothetical protein [Flavobacterium tegetincola]|uniref:hypothetical protein n=1 Tax=Flavobacterium tegetincola TaxID=150172 RepID=UPI000420CB71|nr:hypothetical protein [Flavobacterium tegetincola]
MKKNIVLFSLFILPIVAYLFFASGVNTFSKLPTLTPSIPEFGNWKSLDGEKVQLQGKITILSFGGTDVLKNRGNYFNLNEKIYQRYHKFNDLQFVVLSPIGTEKDVTVFKNQLAASTDMTQWKFVFASPEEIATFYNQLKLKKDELTANYGNNNVYIIDKDRNLRGRKLNSEKEYKEGYSMFYVSELHNEMMDDFKIILYEYKAALKKNHNATKRLHIQTDEK